MNAVFRVDASLQIGSGHVMRCLTLAGRLRADGVVVWFICREHPGHMIDWIEMQGYSVNRLTGPVGLFERGDGPGLAHAHWLGTTQEQDAQEVAAVLRPVGVIDWLVVDHYALDCVWEGLLRTHVRQIMVIDDLADRSHDCDLLLDQNLRRDMTSPYRGWVPPHCTVLLGPHYALLRPEFAAARRLLRKRDGIVRRILVFFGGTDPDNVTAKALDALAQLNQPDLDVDVVVGRSNPNREQIQAVCDQTPHFYYHVQVDNMAQLMAQADLAMGAAGATSWERCCLALPCIVIIMADNQCSVAQTLQETGIAVVLGEFGSVSAEHIAQAVQTITHDKTFFQQMQKNAAAICDGLGTDRVADALFNGTWVGPSHPVSSNSGVSR